VAGCALCAWLLPAFRRYDARRQVPGSDGQKGLDSGVPG
jgi:hypothetical protein